MSYQRKLYFRRWLGLLVVCAIALILFYPKAPPSDRPSNYSLSSRASFNQPSYYPLAQTAASNLYLPTGDWTGRLILPTPKQMQELPGEDWVWLEVYHAPANTQNLIGKKVRLAWSQKSSLRNLTVNVEFTNSTQKSTSQGNVHPDHLNHRLRVGPLQSLAGARPNDDVTVSLNSVTLYPASDRVSVIRTDSEPVQIVGRFYSLVAFVGAATAKSRAVPKVCPGSAPCENEYRIVRHYNFVSKQFDGVEETVRFPQQPPERSGIFPSTPQQIENSPVGTSGWYIYGAKDAAGIFTVEAIKPRSLFQLAPQQVIVGNNPALSYIKVQNWQNTQSRKGTAQTVLVDNSAERSPNLMSEWKQGDRALAIHLFGGIGGTQGESVVGGTVTGHFAYGIAEIVRDPFTQELQFDIKYEQVYAHNPEAIVAGGTTWANYMGNLQRGWLGTRPVSDVIVKLDAISRDYNLGGITLSPLDELLGNLQIMAARYRTGDGTGNATVTPATSCVQDSNQALYLTIESIAQKVNVNPAIQNWIKAHPNHPETRRFQQLAALRDALKQQLIPLGIVRSDWKKNAKVLSGTGDEPQFVTRDSLLAALMSWRTILPRGAQDELSRVFLKAGAQLWFLRTNQVGGHNPDILPVAPTVLFGQFPALSSLIFRSFAGFTTFPDVRGLSIALWALLIYGAVAIPLGVAVGFLQVSAPKGNFGNLLFLTIKALILPVLFEEWLFRVVLLPHPTEGVTATAWMLWIGLSLCSYIIYHPVRAITLFPEGYPTFCQPIFLLLTGLLGVACTVVYGLTGSAWAAIFVHWIVAAIWLFGLGGQRQLFSKYKIRL
ncbi:CPBP family glutamic-type intramembrane protease [Microcoleus sp. bin38.metabat.b11b12b14.051]|uniref:CPBP family glutamic-type intramembrane protease n=1 Tax=Microcoleus sp. bin38.metabat.b11b12b14.051 TaxID=2742709 RepID=UPI0025F66571|nr:CPBP family glutamic-type intramembrane protease [Microcoleus sp. bin38.metabat.b11b12b14.051]